MVTTQSNGGKLRIWHVKPRAFWRLISTSAEKFRRLMCTHNLSEHFSFGWYTFSKNLITLLSYRQSVFNLLQIKHTYCSQSLHTCLQRNIGSCRTHKLCDAQGWHIPEVWKDYRVVQTFDAKDAIVVVFNRERWTSLSIRVFSNFFFSKKKGVEILYFVREVFVSLSAWSKSSRISRQNSNRQSNTFLEVFISPWWM